MLQKASDDPSINFKMHCIELYADNEDADGDAASQPSPTSRSILGMSLPSPLFGSKRESTTRTPLPLSGEIGFSVGRVYTSLSGWTEERTKEGVGTVQLVLLGRWLQKKGYAFWSLGHCYSPEMDYKRQLGHRIYPRADFITLLKAHRGAFRPGDTSTSLESSGERNCTFQALENCESCDARSLLESVEASSHNRM
mmetsp:Transcript_111461/g.193195  ORF Transcript_111461/g.193195 Transcript_111461/m.193195 type:complete len:196 (-) Transcript_111461:175-762(-)